MKTITIVSLPIFIMIELLTVLDSEILLAVLFAAISATSLYLMRARRAEVAIVAFGFVVMSFFEYIFVSTGAEVFTHTSFLGVMPLWLPILWGYGFFAISRGLKVVERRI